MNNADFDALRMLEDAEVRERRRGATDSMFLLSADATGSSMELGGRWGCK